MLFHEKTSRSIAKSITFRAVILMADSLIIYLLTHRLDVTLGVMLFSNLSSTIIYFLHERAWNRIRWGKGLLDRI